MSEKVKQETLFENPPAWVDLWQGMPEFKHDDLTSWKSIRVHFRNREDYEAFAELVDQKLTSRTQSVWFPEVEDEIFDDKRIVSASPVIPRYPIYIPSKGRWEGRLTSKALESMNVPYRIVIEPQERDVYANVIDPAKILVLPFSNLGQGSIPARNWIWEHSIAEGHERHWIIDDNIQAFYRFNKNAKIKIGDGTAFTVIEDFVDRYENVPMSGMQYVFFVPRKDADHPAFTLNTRIYSCILLANNTDLRWRGRYNEDTDLSLRFLKAGFCTILVYAIQAKKRPTMEKKGGNTEELYRKDDQFDGRLEMAKSLQSQHPDVVKITRKWDRWQHQVNYSQFKKNKLRLKPGVVIPEGVNDFGMSLKILEER